MGFARHIGRIGALAVALGVGVAVASTPGIAYAEPSASSTDGSGSTGGGSSAGASSKGKSSTSSPSSSKSSTTSRKKKAANRRSSTDGSDDSSGTGPDSSDPADTSTANRDTSADHDSAVGVDDAEDGDDAGVPASAGIHEGAAAAPTDEDTPPVPGSETAPSLDTGSVQVDDAVRGAVRGDQRVPARSAPKHAAATVDATGDDVDPTVTVAIGQPIQSGRHQARTLDIDPEKAAPASTSFAPSSVDGATTATTTLTPGAPLPPTPQPRPTLVSVVSDLVSAVLNPLLNPASGSPIQMPILTAMLAAVRNDFERMLFPRTTNVASQKTVTLVEDPSTQPALLIDPTDQHVLVIGVDGANLSRILANPENDNFFELMDTSTTAAASIVGHTTISNPSWTAILTGEWGEKTGVINNVFTPWTYDEFPTVFNQLETLDPDIQTMAIANWVGINAIAGAGSIPADENVFIAQIEGDTDWSLTDDAVGDATVDAINSADAPNFLFSYFAGVDENGHMHGGASPQYAAAVQNVDDNLGEIMDAVAAREAATGEDWTIIVVTDHGHTPQLGFGHGFQSPPETETFVIADGPAFQDGFINLQYEIVDTTPTVVTLFGGTPIMGSDGVPLTSLGDSDVDPVNLHQALNDAIAMYGYPDYITDAALALRTIFATIPYYIFTLGNDITAGLPEFVAIPVQIIFDGLYVVTNIPAQIVAMLTGVTGASLFPLLPPEPPMFGPAEEATGPDSVVLACGDSEAAICDAELAA